jgi:hypothetical protein
MIEDGKADYKLRDATLESLTQYLEERDDEISSVCTTCTVVSRTSKIYSARPCIADLAQLSTRLSNMKTHQEQNEGLLSQVQSLEQELCSSRERYACISALICRSLVIELRATELRSSVHKMTA